MDSKKSTVMPTVLTTLRQWVVWKEKSKPTSVETGLQKGWNKDPATYDDAVDFCENHRGYRLGFLFERETPVFGIDLDSCRDPESGTVEPWAAEIIEKFRTYSEVSQSGTGIKLIGIGSPDHRVVTIDGAPQYGEHKPHFEVFCDSKYFAITGDVYGENRIVRDGVKPFGWLAREYPETVIEPMPVKKRAPKVELSDSLEESIDNFNRDNTIVSILVQHGYQLDREGGIIRPGKKPGTGISASTRLDSDGLARIAFWSPNCPPFEQSVAGGRAHTYTAWQCHVFLEHNGDFQVAAFEVFDMKRAIEHPEVDISGICEPMEAQPSSANPENAEESDDFISELRYYDEDGDECPPETDPFPWDAVPTEGLIREMVDFDLKTARYPQPMLAFAGAMTLVSALTGRKIADDRGTRTNIYCIGLCVSGGGKDNARECIKDLLTKANALDYWGNEDLASSAGLVTAVSEKLSCVFLLDEIGHLFAAIKNSFGQRHLKDISSVLMKFYSSSRQLWIGAAYGDSKQTKTINQPHASLFGTCVPNGLWSNMTKENLSDGLLSRMMVFESPGYVDHQKPGKRDIPETLVESVSKWAEYKGEGIDWSIPTPMEIPYDDFAETRLDDHIDGICDKRKTEDADTAALWSRTGEKTAKMALIFACARSTPEVPFSVSLDDVDRAIKISNWLTRRMVAQSAEYVSESIAEDNRKRALRIVPYGRNGIRKRDWTRKTQWLGARDRNDILKDLIDQELIFVEAVQGEGRKCFTALVRVPKKSE